MFLLLLLVTPPAFAKTLPILVFGDSLSANYGITQQQSWVNLLQARLDQTYPRFKIMNASISGETTQGGRFRLPEALAKTRPALVILELGANDGLRGLPTQLMQQNLDVMLAESKAAKARVLLVGMHLPPNYGSAYNEKFHQVYQDLARRHKITFVPFMLDKLTHPLHFQADGVHPTAAAQVIILETIWQQLAPLLKTIQSNSP